MSDNIPEILIPILPFLPRDIDPEPRRENSGQFLTKAQLEMSALSDRGKWALLSLISVCENYPVKSLQDLFTVYSSHIRSALKQVAPSAKWQSIESVYQMLLKVLNIEIEVRKIAIEVNDLPRKLKEALVTFERRAKTGWSDNETMVSLAADNRIELKPLSQSTIDEYTLAFRQGISFVPFDENTEIKDFFKLQVREIEVDGGSITKLVSPLIEPYRERERLRETDSKRSGYDSISFAKFVTGVMTIASYNGIFNLQSELRKHYKIRFDERTRKNKKLSKKLTFSVKWVDKAIVDLRPDFLKIIKNKSFRSDNSSYTCKEKEENLRKCLFYVWLVFLRYTGYRQQCVRDCIYGENIIFQKDDSISVKWNAEQIKNNKGIIATYDPDKHESAYGLFIECMHLYHQHVYKFFSKKYPAKIGNQFFFKPDAERECRKFNKDRCKDFNEVFVDYTQLFLKLDETQLSDLKRALHPQILRGTHADWLHEDLDLTLDDTAVALSDSKKTVETYYLKNDTYNVTPVLDRASRVVDARISKEDTSTFQAYKDTMKMKLSKLLAQNKSEKQKRKKLQICYTDAKRTIKDLKDQLKMSMARTESLEKRFCDFSSLSSDKFTQILSKIELLVEKDA